MGVDSATFPSLALVFSRFMVVELLQLRFYHNAIGAWVAAGATFIGVAAVLFILRGVPARRLARLAARTETRLDDVAVDLLRSTRLYFVIIVALAASAIALELPAPALRALRVLTVLAIALQAGVWGNG